jgi:hypothetical protein
MRSASGAHLVHHDAALGEHADQIEVVDREPGIAPDRGAREPGIRPVGVAIEDDVPVVVGEEELLAVLALDAPDRHELRRLLVEMHPHGGVEVLGHGNGKGWREGAWGRRRVGGTLRPASAHCGPAASQVRRRRLGQERTIERLRNFSGEEVERELSQ